MPCEPFRLGDGVTGIICSRGQRRTKCVVCKTRPSTKLCDFPLSGKKAGQTCDRALCDKCAVKQGDVTRLEADRSFSTPAIRTVASADTVDYCPTHAELSKKVEEQLTLAVVGDGKDEGEEP